MTVTWVWAGANTDDGAMVKVRLGATAAACRLVASSSEDLSSPTYSSSAAPDSDNYVELTIAGLAAATKWHYGVEVDGILDPIRGAFRTLPTEGSATSFTVAFASCAVETAGRDYPVYHRIIEKDPLQFIHTGDFHYKIPDSADESTWVASDWQRFIDEAMSRPNRTALHRAMAVPSMWDDHDYNPNQLGSVNFSKKDVVAGVYRQARPHYPIAATDPGDNAIYQSWRLGRVWVVMPDLRYHRDQYTDVAGTTGTMLGADQLAWVHSEFLAAKAADAPLILFVSSSVWTNEQHADTWGPAGDERAALSKFTVDNDIPPVVVLSGDMHAHAWSSGMPLGTGTRPWPEHVSAALAAPPGAGRPSAYWGVGPLGAMGQYSTLTVDDDGVDFSYTVRGYRTDLVTGEETLLYETVDNVLTYPDESPDTGTWVAREIRVWDGAAWVRRPVRWWDTAAGAWVDRPVQVAL